MEINHTNQPINPIGTSAQPIQHPINNQRGSFPIILGVLVLLLVVGGGVYYFGIQKRQTLNTTPLKQNPSPKATSESLPSPITQATSIVKLTNAWKLGMKTFSDPKINISFDYPSYFQTRVTDIEKENKEWASKYKNDPNVKQPLYRSSFSIVFFTPDFDTSMYADYDKRTLICDNKMSVSVQQYDNPQNISFYDFIADLNKNYPGNGVTESFDTYKKSLIQSQLPKTGSYVFKGIIGENPVKEVYFTNKDKVYKFHLIGNCDTGGQYTPDAEAVFDYILKSVKYL